jgi:lipopolysaccharide export system protein LptA
MRKNLTLLATLALAATLSPAAFAQQDQSPQPGTTDPQAQTAPAPDAQSLSTFAGTVVKMGKHYGLKTETATYPLDDDAKAKQFAGKQVTVSGTLNESSGMIHVADIQPAS